MQPRTTTPAPDEASGPRYRAAAARATSFSVQPSSASGTKRGQAVWRTSRPGSSARIARPYASDATVASVARTAIGPRGAARGLARARRGDGRGRSRRDDADHGHGRHLDDRVERERRGRVARDDDGLHAVVQQEPDRAPGVTPYGLGRLRPVREARRVAEVEKPLVREPAGDGVEDGQPADARVEEADGPLVAHVVSPRGRAGARCLGGRARAWAPASARASGRPSAREAAPGGAPPRRRA